MQVSNLLPAAACSLRAGRGAPTLAEAGAAFGAVLQLAGQWHDADVVAVADADADADLDAADDAGADAASTGVMPWEAGTAVAPQPVAAGLEAGPEGRLAAQAVWWSQSERPPQAPWPAPTGSVTAIGAQAASAHADAIVASPGSSGRAPALQAGLARDPGRVDDHAVQRPDSGLERAFDRPSPPTSAHRAAPVPQDDPGRGEALPPSPTNDAEALEGVLEAAARRPDQGTDQRIEAADPGASPRAGAAQAAARREASTAVPAGESGGDVRTHGPISTSAAADATTLEPVREPVREPAPVRTGEAASGSARAGAEPTFVVQAGPMAGQQTPSGATTPEPHRTPVAEVMLATRWESPEALPALGRQIALFAREGIEHARVQINPVDLGPIQVQLALDGTQVRLELVAEVASTRSLLEQSLPCLASSLREGGFTLSGGGVFQEPRRGPEGDGQAPRSPGTAAAQGSGHDPDGQRPAPSAVRRSAGLVDLYA